MKNSNILKRTAIAISLITAISFSALANADGTVCITKQEIKTIAVGEAHHPYGADGGNAIYVTFADGTSLPVNAARNLNDAMGGGILNILNTAFSLRLPVSVIDHNGAPCDDFDEVVTYRD